MMLGPEQLEICHGPKGAGLPAPPQLHFKTPHIPSNRDHKALNRSPLGRLGCDKMDIVQRTSSEQ